MRSLTGGFLDVWVKTPHVVQASRRFGPCPWPPVPDVISALPALPARVYEGLWIVDCPCGGAEMICRGHPILWCCSCGNRYAGGLWRQVELPANAPEIERLLDLRPFPVNQNWQPGETVDQLRAENAEHGL